ncbi:MAG: DUF2726 domain-containing protein [Sedimenticola sp.]
MPERESSYSPITYQCRPKLFSSAENDFLRALRLASHNRGIVLAKVRAIDILKPSADLEEASRQRALKLISTKRFDFVVCDINDHSVISVVELDQSTRYRRDLIMLNRFLDKACRQAGLRLHRFKASASYDARALRDLLFPGHGEF